jgi:hypothetical protein
MPSIKSQSGEAALKHLTRTENLPDFDLGVTRFFGLGDLNSRYFDHGWATPEQNHSWNDGIDASLLISLKSRPTQTCALQIRGMPYLTDKIQKQDMTLYVNGYRAAFWRLDARQTYLLVAEIAPEFWVERNGKGFAKCVWHIPGSAIPSETAAVNDKRQLGFCFLEITLDRWPT